MPIYELKCNNGHITEVIVPISEYKRLKSEGITCQHSISHKSSHILDYKCRLNAKLIFSRFNTNTEGEPTRIFKNPNTGEVQIAANKYDKPPRGFITQELKGSIQRSKFEKERNKQLNELDQAIIEDRRIKSSISQNNRHAEINAKMSTFDPNTQTLMKEAMKRSRKKELPKPTRKEAGFQINHIDKSNLT